jgi:hypothetical protein
MHDEELTSLEEGLRRLKIEYHIFFHGNQGKAPDELRLRIERLVKKLSESADLSFSQRFRFNTLVARYYVYRDLWRRTQQEREMGAEGAGGAGSKAAAAPTPSAAPMPGPALRVSIADPEAEEGKVRKLYEALVAARKTERGKAQISYPQFAELVATRTRSIRQQHGCSRVAFTIALKEESIRFTAAAETVET